MLRAKHIKYLYTVENGQVEAEASLGIFSRLRVEEKELKQSKHPDKAILAMQKELTFKIEKMIYGELRTKLLNIMINTVDYSTRKALEEALELTRLE